MRIGAFFGRPPLVSTFPSSSDDVSSTVSSRRSSIGELDIEMPLVETKPTPLKNTDYEKMFPSFFVFENMEVAPINRFLMSRQLHASLPYSDFPQISIDGPVSIVKEIFPSQKRKKRRILPPVREIVDQIHGTLNAPIDLTKKQDHSYSTRLLEQIPIKILAFREDVRPPYQGTYTRPVSPRLAAKISKNPFHRGLPETDYNYDSEAEWEEPTEGDDVNTEDEDSESEADEEEMDDFLDDENDGNKRRMVVGDMEPVCTGLCWESDTPLSNLSKLHEYRIDVLDDANSFPIDPYTTEYWATPTKSSSRNPEIKTEGTVRLMQPPRLPLSSINTPNACVNQGFLSASGPNAETSSTENTTNLAKVKRRGAELGKPLKMVSSDLLPAFKQAISGSDLTKAGLVEVLKKQFPKVSKDTIKDTLSAVASREGLKEADKRWILTS